MLKIKLLASALLLIVFFWGLTAEAAIFHFSGVRPLNLGVQEGKLLPCPPSPNCVSSQSTDPLHQIAALQYTTDRLTALQKLTKVLEKQPNTKIVKQEEDYIYSEFTTSLMGFVDDVEFYAPSDRLVIEVRSASRLGESDLGVNRDRVELIRSELD